MPLDEPTLVQIVCSELRTGLISANVQISKRNPYRVIVTDPRTAESYSVTVAKSRGRRN